jgi:hypothetical protein
LGNKIIIEGILYWIWADGIWPEIYISRSRPEHIGNMNGGGFGSENFVGWKIDEGIYGAEL